MKTKNFMFAGVILLLLSSSCFVWAATIEFDSINFFTDTPSFVEFGGSSVKISESGDATTFISNDPDNGDPVLIAVGGDPFFIEFEYQFILESENIDDFAAFVYLADGNYDQLRWEYTDVSTPTSGPGISADGYKSVIWDMSGLGLNSGDILGIDFVLGTFDSPDNDQEYLDSSVTIRNLQVRIDPVPEPGTFFLLGLGILGLAGCSRKIGD